MTQIKIVSGKTVDEIEKKANDFLLSIEGNVQTSTALYHTDAFYLLIELNSSKAITVVKAPVKAKKETKVETTTK